MAPTLDTIYSGETQLVIAKDDGSYSLSPPDVELVLLPGSFNPLHGGHQKLLDTASRLTGRRGMFEISIENVDKPDLPKTQLKRRLEQFAGYRDVAVTRAALFSDKAKLLPGAWFVLGFDTAIRLLDDRYYPGIEGQVSPAGKALHELADVGVRFVVAGREDDSGRFREADELDVPKSLRGMFIFIPASEFRADISSTQLRREQ